jgi:formylglycine-generating enzyme required for sulfatase activity
MKKINSIIHALLFSLGLPLGSQPIVIPNVAKRSEESHPYVITATKLKKYAIPRTSRNDSIGMTPLKSTSKLILLFLVLTSTIVIGKNKDKASGMALIPAGTYTPLYVDDTTDQSIKVDSFLIDKYPVTNKEFLEFVKANPKWQRSKVSSLFSDESYLSHWKSDTELGPNVNPDAPVTNVSWFAAKAFAKYHGKRLPTVAEWELAAKADEKNPDGYKNPEYIARILSWYSKPNSSTLPSVGSVFKNYYGVYDMHGLVWEWTADYFNALVTGESRANSGINRNLFCGSGSVGATDFTNYPAFMRFAFRSSLKGNYTTNNLGFRCAKDIK